MKCLKNVSKLKLFSVAAVVLASGITFTTNAADGVSGKVYADYNHYTKHHDAAHAGQHGMVFRRIYFTYKKSLDNDWSSKFRFEMGGADVSKGKSKMSPVVKDMYLAKKFGNHKMLIGISDAPTFSFQESHWGYRSVEKTPLDLYKMRSSRDMGIAFKGKLGSMVDYHLMFGNGNGNESEDNKYKTYALSTVLHPMSSIALQLYYDLATSADKKTDKSAYQAFLAWTGASTKAGFMFTKLDHKLAGTSYKATVFSFHATHKLCKKMTMLARFDSVKYDDPKGIASDKGAYKAQSSYLPISDKATKFTTIIAGLDYKPASQVHIIPNVELVNYEKSEVGTNDFVSRVTIAYKF